MPVVKRSVLIGVVAHDACISRDRVESGQKLVVGAILTPKGERGPLCGMYAKCVGRHRYILNGGKDG